MLQGRNPLTPLIEVCLLCAIPAQMAAALPAAARGQEVGGLRTGYITVNCGDHRMLITLDGAELGECPLDSVPASPGSHLLSGWRIDDRRFSSASFSRTIRVEAGVECVVDLSAMRWVRIESEPFGALVTREGVPLGNTPLIVPVTPGDSPLILERDGFRVAVISARSLLSGPSTMRVGLEPEHRRRTSSVIDVESPSRKERLGLSTFLTGVTMVASATAAVVLKKQADDEFERYKSTGDLDRMNEFFDRAEKLDTWAVGSWIVCEVTLGILIYQLLRSPEPEPTER